MSARRESKSLPILEHMSPREVPPLMLGGQNSRPPRRILPSVKVDAFSKIVRPSLGKLIREVDAMLRPGGVLYVGFQSIATFCS